MFDHLLWLTTVKELKEVDFSLFSWLMQKGLARGYCDPFVHLYLENDDQEKLQKLFLSIQEPEIMVTFFLKISL